MGEQAIGPVASPRFEKSSLSPVAIMRLPLAFMLCRASSLTGQVEIERQITGLRAALWVPAKQRPGVCLPACVISEGLGCCMTAPRWLPVAVILAGVLLRTVAITYFTVPAQSLPSLMGIIPGSDVIRWKRGVLFLVLAVGCLFFGVRRARGGRSQNP